MVFGIITRKKGVKVMISIQRGVLLVIAICIVAWPCYVSSNTVGIVYSKDYHAERLQLLKKNGFQPKVVYDIGAFKGRWTSEVQKIFDQAQFFLFEANENFKPFLHDLKVPFFCALLGDQEGLVTFYVNNTTGDSVFREQTKFYQDGKCDEKQVQMTTLNALVQEHGLPLPELIKMDVQGAEMLIIQGSPSIICNAEVVILETKILEYNKEAPLVYEMIALMHELGYRILDVLELHYLPTEELNEVDLLFVKNDSPLIKRGILW